MSIEIDRERFLAQYWNQEVAVVDDGGEKYLGFTGEQPHEMENISWLLLRSIESLTDEECIEFEKNYPLLIPGHGYDKEKLVYKVRSFLHFRLNPNPVNPEHFPYKVADYLRSIGILVPFAQYSVEEILSLGWAVVKK